MISAILCEGKTDAILISYYLEKVRGWHHVKKQYEGPVIQQTQDNESIEYYELGNDLLMIWGVGGKSRFTYAIDQLITFSQRRGIEKAYTKIAILLDRDKTEDDNEILLPFNACLNNKGLTITLTNNQWMSCKYSDVFGDLIDIRLLSIIIPFDRNGAVETFLLQAISERDPEDQQVVSQCKTFVAGFSSRQYLQSERLKIKAELATTFAMISPEKVFTPLDALLKSIPWEKYATIQTGFKLLDQI